MDDRTSDQVGRRIVFQGLGAMGVAVALAGCGGGGSDDDGGSTGSGPSQPAAGTVLTPAADVPVGGGVVLAGEGLVVTQPSAGEFRAFTAVCTHQGAALGPVSDEGIECPLHGSRFSVGDGAPTQGPATEPLAEVPVTVSGDEVVVA